MTKWLQKDPQLRFDGCFATIKADPWFNKIDWVICFISNRKDNLLMKEFSAPFKPTIPEGESNDSCKN